MSLKFHLTLWKDYGVQLFWANLLLPLLISEGASRKAAESKLEPRRQLLLPLPFSLLKTKIWLAHTKAAPGPEDLFILQFRKSGRPTVFSLSSVQMLVGLCTRPQGRPGVGSSEPAGLGKAGAATEPAFYRGPEGLPLPSTSAWQNQFVPLSQQHMVKG